MRYIGADAKIMESRLKCVVTYLKSQYFAHCQEVSDAASHCAFHSLSHPTDTTLQQICNIDHKLVCPDCFNVTNCFKMITSALDVLPNSDEKEEALVITDRAKMKVLAWMKHIMRSYQQGKARKTSLDKASSSIVWWLRDYAQKILPVKALESMQDYFAKRGISVHVDVFMRKVGEIWYKNVYITCLDGCKQDLVDTLCIADHVLSQFRLDVPIAEVLYGQSDNAGSYHSNDALETLYVIANKHGFNLKEYHFSEPQKVC